MNKDDVNAAIQRVEETVEGFYGRLRLLYPDETAEQISARVNAVIGQRYRQFRAEVECLADAGIATRAPLH
jgi:hypothetical protein